MQTTPIPPSENLLDYIDFNLMVDSAICGIFGHYSVTALTPSPVGFFTLCGANLLVGTLKHRSTARHRYVIKLLIKNREFNQELKERVEQLSGSQRQNTLKITENQTKIENLEKDIKEWNKKPMEKLDLLYREHKEINESCKTNREEIAALRELLNEPTVVTDQPAPLNQLPTVTAQQKNK